VTILASLPPEWALPAKALAEYHGISESYLVKHLKSLAAAGILRSIPGPKGGYAIGRPPANITLLDIVEAVEGREPAFRCAEIRQRGPICSREPGAYRLPCALNAAMLKAESAWRAELRSQTVAELVAHLGETLDPKLLAESAAWLQVHARS
jgi:Rrf2 family protein